MGNIKATTSNGNRPIQVVVLRSTSFVPDDSAERSHHHNIDMMHKEGWKYEIIIVKRILIQDTNLEDTSSQQGKEATRIFVGKIGCGYILEPDLVVSQSRSAKSTCGCTTRRSCRISHSPPVLRLWSGEQAESHAKFNSAGSNQD